MFTRRSLPIALAAALVCGADIERVPIESLQAF
jgi:hypothetical protein